MNKKISWVAAAALMGLPLMASAQVDPADPGAAAPALGYQSAFSDYKPWQDIKPADWRAVNDTVRDAKPGVGHGGQGATPASGAPASAARAPAAAQQAAPAPTPAPPPAVPAPAAQGPSSHSGHGGHK